MVSAAATQYGAGSGSDRMLALKQHSLSFTTVESRIRSLPPPQPGCPAGDPGPLPALYLVAISLIFFSFSRLSVGHGLVREGYCLPPRFYQGSQAEGPLRSPLRT